MQKTMQFLAGMLLACFALNVHAQLKPLVLTKTGIHPEEDCYPTAMSALPDGGSVMVGFKMNVGAPGWESTYCLGYITWMNADGSKRKEIIIAQGQSGACSLDVALVDRRTSEVYVVGQTCIWTGKYASCEVGDDDGFIIKYDAQGNEEWVKVIRTKGDGGFTGAVFDENGNILVAGNQADFYLSKEFVQTHSINEVLERGMKTNDQFTLATFSPEGEFMDLHIVPMPYVSIEGRKLFEPAGDGNYWLVGLGRVRGATLEQDQLLLHLFKMKPNGDIIADKLFRGAAHTMIDDLRPLRNGGVLVAARTYGTSGDVTEGGDHLFCLDADANLLWQRNFSEGDIDDPHMVVIETDEGNILAAMFAPGMVPEFAAYPRSRFNLWMIKMTADGKDIWKRSLLALDWYQAPSDINIVNGEIRMALNGQGKAVALQYRSKDAWYCMLKDF